MAKKILLLENPILKAKGLLFILIALVSLVLPFPATISMTGPPKLDGDASAMDTAWTADVSFWADRLLSF